MNLRRITQTQHFGYGRAQIVEQVLTARRRVCRLQLLAQINGWCRRHQQLRPGVCLAEIAIEQTGRRRLGQVLRPLNRHYANLYGLPALTLRQQVGKGRNPLGRGNGPLAAFRHQLAIRAHQVSRHPNVRPPTPVDTQGRQPLRPPIVNKGIEEGVGRRMVGLALVTQQAGHGGKEHKAIQG